MPPDIYALSFLVTTYKRASHWVLFNWLSMSHVNVSDERHPLYVALERGHRHVCREEFEGRYDDFTYLCDQNFIVRDQLEVEQLVWNIYRATHSETDLTLTVMPSGFLCNFRCAYCNQPHYSERIMGQLDKDIILRFLERSSLSSLRLDYFGGEPLINSEFLIQLNTEAMELAKKRRFKFMGSSLTTNGYLLNSALFKKLVAVGVSSYQITLDGLKEDHDVLRKTVKGQGSHDVIFTNLGGMLADRNNICSITLRMNLGPENGEGNKLNQWIDSVKKAIGCDDRVVIQVQIIGNWKEEGDNGRLYFEPYLAKTVQREAEKKFEEAGFNILRAAIYGAYEAHHCYSGKTNNLILFPAEEQNGKWTMPVEKCTFYTKRVKNNVGVISDEGVFQREDKAWDRWVRSTPFSRNECTRCFFVLHCFGVSCSLNNQIQGATVCPNEKDDHEYEVTKIMNYLQQNTPSTGIAENI